MQRLNGKSLIIQAVFQIVVVAILFWMFCIVRDFPALYVSKADAQISKEELRQDMKQIYFKLDSIETHLRNKQ